MRSLAAFSLVLMNAAMKVVDAVTSKMNRVGMEEVRGALRYG